MITEEVPSIYGEWRSFYGNQKPVASLLREEIPENWLRVHTLPMSKRYAETESEMLEILRRYNTIGDSILGEGTNCVLFYNGPNAATFRTSIHGFYGSPFETCHEPALSICAGRTRWQNGRFDSILRRVANDRIHYVSFFNNVTGEIFAPYDGGADMFLSSATRHNQLKTRFSGWLSHHSKGL